MEFFARAAQAEAKVREFWRIERKIKHRHWQVMHNMVAHPLLEIYRPWGERLHKWTADRMYDDDSVEYPIPDDGPVNG